MKRLKGRERRHKRIKKKLFGTLNRPRMVVYRSLKNLYVQLIDDIENKTIISVSTNTPALKEKIRYGGNVKAATLLGEFLAKRAQQKGISVVVFDRSGYMFHGRVKALAESAKKGGLSFGTRIDTNKNTNPDRNKISNGANRHKQEN